MRRIALLLAAMLSCTPAIAADKPDLLARVLEKCPLEDRRAFLGSLQFIGDKIAGMHYRPIADCLGTLKLSDLGARLARAGNRASPSDARDLPLEGLFSGCSAAVRERFYDGLQFRDGRLVGLFVGGVKKCGARDLPRFLSLFGPDGMDAVDWKADCYCRRPGANVRRVGYVCSPDGC